MVPANRFVVFSLLIVVAMTARPALAQTGGCCLSSGACVEVTALECIQFGGDYQGNGSTCDACGASGACCLPSGTCFVLAPALCSAQGGTYQGDGTSCGGVACPIACGFGDSCFEPSPNTACSDADCCNAVCAVDPFCCSNSWDGLCVANAFQICAGCGGADAGICWESSSAPACDDAVCCQIVCTLDPYCCNVVWDDICADLALTECDVPFPPNDDCVDADLVFEGQTPFSTVLATTDGTQGACADAEDDIWFHHVAACTGRLTVSTCVDTGGAADYDTVLYVYHGCVCTRLIPLGCNDDDINHPCGLPAHQSTVEVSVVEDECYTIRVGGWHGDSGSGVLYTACAVNCPCDLDQDGDVDVDDLLTLLAAWLQSPAGDCNGDGSTTVDDLLVLLASFGSC